MTVLHHSCEIPEMLLNDHIILDKATANK